MKKLLQTLLCILFVIPASAADGDNFEYNGLWYTVISEEDATCKTRENINGTYYSGSGGIITLPSNIPYKGKEYTLIEIGERTFGNASSSNIITEIYLPNTVKTIGGHAFIHCTGLKYLHFGLGLEFIGEGALGFVKCDVLECEAIVPPILDVDCMYSSSFNHIYVPTMFVDTYKATSFNRAYGWADKSNVITGKDFMPLITYKGINYFIDDEGFAYTSTNTDYKGSLILPDNFYYEDKHYILKDISPGSFSNCIGLTSVVIPNSVTSIGYRAFNGCTGLTSVVIPNSVRSIGNDAFSGCSGLTSVEIPNSVTSIGDRAFYSCPIEDLSLDSKKIESWFRGFTTIKNLELGNSVTSIGDYAFSDCSGLTSVEIPNSVTSIGNFAFYGCSGLTGELKIPSSVTSIGNSAFYGCDGLRSIEIPNSVTSIGDYAFSYCKGLTRIEIPNSVTSIGEGAFSKCNELMLLIFNSEKCEFCGSSSSPAFPSSITEIQIGNNVKNIPDYAFYGCLQGKTENITVQVFDKGLGFPEGSSNASDTAVTYKASDTQISYSLKGSYINSGYLMINGKNYSDAYIEWTLDVPMDKLIMTTSGSGSMNAQSRVNVYANNKVLVSGLAVDERNTAYSVSIPLEYQVPGTKYKVSSDSRDYNQQFASFQYLNEGRVSDGNTDESTNMTCLSIPNSVSSIGKSAFEYCTLIDELKLPGSLTSISNDAFSGCGITKISLDSEIPPSYYSTFSEYEEKATLTIPDNADINAYLLSEWRNFLNIVQENGDKLFLASDDVFDYRFIESLGKAYLVPSSKYVKMTSVSIPDRVVADKNGKESFYYVTGISPNAFKDCTMITQVKLPANCEFIGDNAFKGCTGFTIIKIPSLVNFIGNSAFESCTGLTNLVINNSVTNIGSSAFYDCQALSSVDISDIESWCSIVFGNSYSNPLYYARLLFLNDEKVVDLKIPDTVSSICDYAFYNFKGLENLTIPNSVKAIGPNSFTYCPIRTLNIDCQNVESWFSNNTSLEYLTLGENVSSIGDKAFFGCTGLTNMPIPRSVTSIGSSAFEGCTGLNRVDITDLAAWCNISFKGHYSNPLSKANHLFLNEVEITKLKIPNSVTSIGDFTFDGCSGLMSVEIGNSVASIGRYAFAGCSELASVQISNSVSTIGERAFQDCSLLTSLKIPYSVTSIGNDAFLNIAFDSFSMEDGLEILSWGSSNNISATNLYVGRNTEGKISYSKIKSLEVGPFVESIPANRFNNSSLTSLVINPGSGIAIEDEAFKGCNRLSEITLPEDIAEIGDNAFSGTALKNITVPNGIIEANAFARCNLENIIIGAGVESIGENAFEGSNALKAVYATPTTPPTAENNTFSYYEAQLYVPEEAIDTYYNYTRCWYRFNGKPLIMPEYIEIDGPSYVSGKAGETLQLTAIIQPSNVTLDRVLWRSTNPAIASVDNNGLVTFHDFEDNKGNNKRYCEIIATTLYEDSPVAIVRIDSSSTLSIEYINSENINSGMKNNLISSDIYTLQGVCLKRDATQSDIDNLAPGIYIIGGKKVMIK